MLSIYNEKTEGCVFMIRYSILVLAWMFVKFIHPVYAVNKTHVIVFNGLARCVQAWPVERYEQGDLLILKAKFTLRNDLKKCGCFSDSVYYAGLIPEKTVAASLLNPHGFLQHGYFFLDKDKLMDLALSSDLGVVRGKKLALYLRCRQMGK